MEQTERQCIYTNRELSWLAFNERVLEEAESNRTPLFERLRFLSIYQNNLDEFFMVRVGGLQDQMLLKQSVLDSKTGLTAREQLTAIYTQVRTIQPRIDQAYLVLSEQLEKQGIQHRSTLDLSKEDLEYLKLYFDREIYPLISPQIVDKRHPFPFLRNKEQYIGVHITSKNHTRLGLIPASGHFSRFILLPRQNDLTRFVLAEELILLFAEQVFHRYTISEKTIFRVTRNADLDVEEELSDIGFDYREAMEELLRERRKLAPVRLELSHPVSHEFSNYLCKHLQLTKSQVFPVACPLDFTFIHKIERFLSGKPDLFYEPFSPQASSDFHAGQPIIPQILEKDILLHYPYHSMQPFIRLLREAAIDESVVSIKITLYRVARDSKVIYSLMDAAENGKEVQVMVELRARFDEENNIDWSKQLEEAGCTVMYGLPGYKVHSKLLLITRKTADGIENITQIGTGNYNERTSKLYTDLSLFTANSEIAADASVVFNNLFMGTVVDDSSTLLVAPHCMKTRIMQLIDQEIAAAQRGEPAQILLKMNSFTERSLMDKLVEASQAGVTIRMIVRGICCIKPGISGYTENIQIISIVGRFLEHSRFFVFGVGARQQIYLSSADFMSRNMKRRVEVAAPVYDSDIRKQLLELFELLWRDNCQVREQQPDGTYQRRIPSNTPFVAQEALAQQTAQAQNQQEQDNSESKL